MSECDRLRHSLGAYVLGALDVEEAAAVHRHVENCPECAAERDSLAPLPELLTLAGGAEAATAEPLPAAFEERLLDAYARDRVARPHRRRRFPKLRRRMRVRWMAAAAGAAAVAAAAVAAVAVLSGGDEQPQYNLALESTGAVPEASARGRLESEEEGTELRLWVRGLPGDTRAVYEVLCEAPGLRASAGTFRVDADGRAYVRLNTAARRGEYDLIRIVRRSRDSSGELVTSDVLRAELS
jgi:Putative zinc-finger